MTDTHTDVENDEFDENATGILRMEDGDARVRGAASRCVVQKSDTLFAQVSGDRIEVGDPVGELLQAGSGAVDELRDRRVLVQRCEQLDLGGTVGAAGNGEHCLPDSLLLVDLFVRGHEPDVLGVPRECGIEIGHGDADVIDRSDEPGGQS